MCSKWFQKNRSCHSNGVQPKQCQIFTYWRVSSRSSPWIFTIIFDLNAAWRLKWRLWIRGRCWWGGRPAVGGCRNRTRCLSTRHAEFLILGRHKRRRRRLCRERVQTCHLNPTTVVTVRCSEWLQFQTFRVRIRNSPFWTSDWNTHGNGLANNYVALTTHSKRDSCDCL
jgi:hypothetical protein